jgi:hypothetical protein
VIMPALNLLAELGEKGADKEALAARVMEHPKLLPDVLAGLRADTARVRFGCASLLEIISEQKPALLLPHFEFLVALLDSPNNIFKWVALRILGNLAAADPSNRFEALFDRFFSLIAGPEMIAAANAMQAGAAIARAKPEWADRIAREILKVTRAQYKTDECLNIGQAHALDALDSFFDLIQDREPVRQFARDQLENPRPAARKRAERFLRKHP